MLKLQRYYAFNTSENLLRDARRLFKRQPPLVKLERECMPLSGFWIGERVFVTSACWKKRCDKSQFKEEIWML